MKRLILLLGFLLIISFNVQAQETLEEQKQTVKQKPFFPETISDSTVSLTLPGYGIVSCSGVLIKEEYGKSYVLSAKHCINARNTEIRVENNKVEYIISSVDEDLILLIVDGHISKKIPVELALLEADFGERIFHSGYPNWIEFRSSGVVTKKLNDHHYAFMIVKQGCSGGGLFNKYGRLVGILWGHLDLIDIEINDKKIPIEVTIYEPLSDIKKFLETINYEI